MRNDNIPLDKKNLPLSRLHLLFSVDGLCVNRL